MIDGWAVTLGGAMLDHKLGEVCKNWIDHGWYPADELVMVVNLDTWNRLPKNLQQLMADVVKKDEGEEPAYFKAEEERARKAGLAAGAKPVVFSPEDAKSYLDLANSSMWEEIKKNVSPELYDKLYKAAMK
jgi:TRAP-type C4-dicarboxylate transport system substrate-binding protein